MGLLMNLVLGTPLKFRAVVLMKMLVRVLNRWQLHNSGDYQRLAVLVAKRPNQIAVHLPDELQWYLFGAYSFTFAVVRAAAKVLITHRNDHAQGPLVALRLDLGKRVKVSYFGRGKKHGGCVRASRDAGSAADACSRVKCSVC